MSPVDPAGRLLDPRFPQSIEVRVPGRTTRHLVDYDALSWPACMTMQTYCSAAAHALLCLRDSLVEEAILEGHNRFEVQIQGDRTTLYTVPRWSLAFGARLKVEWARWRRRHPEAGTRLLEALAWSGTVWSSGHIPTR